MAIITGITTGNMCWVFADGRYAIMAGATSANNLGVIDCVCRNLQRASVAIFANIGGLDVRQALAGGSSAVVTTAAISDDTGVIEGGR